MTEAPEFLNSRLGTATPDSVAVHCMDARYMDGFDELLLSVLGADPLRIVVPGGAWWLAQAASAGEGRLRKFLLHGRVPAQEFVDTFLRGRGLKRVVMVGHQDCRWYHEMNPKLSDEEILRLQTSHILRARNEIDRWASHAMESHGFLLRSKDAALVADRLF